jgi:hypothetical protein
VKKTQETLEAALREHGVADLSGVEMAVLEIDTISGRTIHGPLEMWVHRVCRVHLPIILQDYGVQ